MVVNDTHAAHAGTAGRDRGEVGGRGGRGGWWWWGKGRTRRVVMVVEGFPLVVKPVDCDDLLGSETRDGNVSRCASVTSGRHAQVSAPGLSGAFVD